MASRRRAFGGAGRRRFKVRPGETWRGAYSEVDLRILEAGSYFIFCSRVLFCHRATCLVSLRPPRRLGLMEVGRISPADNDLSPSVLPCARSHAKRHVHGRLSMSPLLPILSPSRCNIQSRRERQCSSTLGAPWRNAGSQGKPFPRGVGLGRTWSLEVARQSRLTAKGTADFLIMGAAAGRTSGPSSR